MASSTTTISPDVVRSEARKQLAARLLDRDQQAAPQHWRDRPCRAAACQHPVRRINDQTDPRFGIVLPEEDGWIGMTLDDDPNERERQVPLVSRVKQWKLSDAVRATIGSRTRSHASALRITMSRGGAQPDPPDEVADELEDWLRSGEHVADGTRDA